MTADPVTSTRPELLVSDAGHVRTLTIDRPERANALSRSLMTTMVEELLRAGEDSDVWVIVITATGDRSFCAGADMKDMSARDEAGVPFRDPMHRPERTLFEVLAETFKPTIAALNGSAVGGGFELALACDLRVVSETAKLGLPEAKRGMGANYGSVVLPRLIPLAFALEMMFTGEYITAADALRLGIANRVVPPDQVGPTAAALAAQIASNAPLTIRRMKEMAIKGLALPVASALRLDVGPNPYLSEDRQEGIRAFVDKRPPRWKGR